MQLLQSIWSKIKSLFSSKKPFPNLDVNNLTFSCCYCATGVRQSDPDFAQVIIEATTSKDIEQPIVQIFWCHADCLKSKLHDAAKEYFLKN